MPEFGGLWKHQKNSACTKSVRVFIMLKLDTVQKKKEEDTLWANLYKMNTTFHITADYHLSYNIQLQTLCLSDIYFGLVHGWFQDFNMIQAFLPVSCTFIISDFVITHVHICMHTHAYMYAHVHACMHTHTHTYNTHAHTCACTHTRTHPRTHEHMHACMQTHTHTLRFW